ncbi:MAG: hydrogenase maturation nickel metallochaperone HypA, partial [Anaerolineaceae bacterium]|nr:hydrogenase maturation nickel metallochaperone HypA [Anaerolineaceae bacterium]
MHELGIVTHVIKTLTDVAAENELTRIGSVTMEVGEVSGVINDLIVDCWNYMCHKKGPLFDGCELKLEILPA